MQGRGKDRVQVERARWDTDGLFSLEIDEQRRAIDRNKPS
jgi:hypothetical protein